MRYPSVLFFYLSTLSYFVTFVLYLLHVVFHPHPRPLSPPRERGDGGEGATLGIIAASASWGLSNIAWGVWAPRALLASVILSGAGVIARAIELGNASQWVKVLLLPLSTTYETLTFFSWLIPLIYFVMERKFQIKQVGVFVTGAAFVMLSVAASRDAGWRGGLVAWLSVLGYLAVLYAWIGINYFVSSLHSFV
jgi:ABC-type transport system involved in cytochrome c biogenesis permease subunit